ncbi:MAG: Type IV pilus inner membrane protein PilC [candidate division TM6 bacterium GW2011_GWF2_28_16]|nr:MAG: Type IV pilus inner membrane protein PilC [candidate division TM6 bacterium GW2011_GWF2_28_16]
MEQVNTVALFFSSKNIILEFFMPLYKYESFNRSGKKIEGTIDASSKESAKNTLQGQNLLPYKIEELGEGNIEFSLASFFESPVELKTKVAFTKQLAVLLKSGVPLLQCLELLIEQFDKSFKRVLINIKDGVKSGQTFASQLAKYPKIFPNVYVQLVKAGEASGKLHIILNNLISYMVKEEETRKKIKKASSYPLFILSFAFLVVIGLITILVPKITDMFIKMGNKELPGPTLFLKYLSDFFLEYYLVFFIVLFFLIILFSYWKSTLSGKKSLDSLFLKLPLISYFSKTKAVVQFSQTLGILLDAGVNLSESLDIVSSIVENSMLFEKLESAKNNIIKEGKIAKYLKQTGIFPNIAIYMIDTGEQSGKLGEMLLTVGNDYNDELNEITDSLVSKIGPIVTIITGVIIGFIVLSVFLPMMDMSNLPGM